MLSLLAPYRLYAYLALAIVLAGLLFQINHWRINAGKLADAEARTAQIERESQQTIANMKTRYAASQRASQGYQNELQAIRDRKLSNVPVRLCSQPRVPATRSIAPGSSSALPAAGILPEQRGSDLEQGIDIGPELRELFRECEEVSAKGRAIQGLR